MADTIGRLDSPIDVVRLIHKALRSEAARVGEVVVQLESGDSLQRFKLALNTWLSALAYHAEQGDKYIMNALADAQNSVKGDLRGPGGSEEPWTGGRDPGLVDRVKAAIVAQADERQQELFGAMQDLLGVLNEEIGRTSVIARTKHHLHRGVVALRVRQEDQAENEETLILPLLRERMSERQQLEVAKGLLIDKGAQDPRWVIHWVAEALSPVEKQQLADLEQRFSQLAETS